MRFNIFSPTGTVTSEFGSIDSVRNFKPHTGVDFACREGLPIHSLTDGVVSKVTNESSTLGNGLFIKTKEGFSFIYGHASELKVGLSDVVQRGDVIALCGSTGRATGSHLHLAVKSPEGKYIDPQEALELIKAMFKRVFEEITEMPL